MSTATVSRHVAIIGGGIAGLSAAWYLEREAARLGIDVRYTVLEASERWGGKVFTERTHDCVIELGADAFLTRKPAALTLARELGLDSRIQYVNTSQHGTFVLHRGHPIPLPEGLQLLVPTKLRPFLESPLFTLRGKARMLVEQWIPARGDNGDESLASFVRRRMGSEALDRLGEPLLAGIYNGEAERLSMRATFAQFPAMEREHGSLMAAARKTQKPNSERQPPFFSFIGGTQELVDGLVAQLKGDLRLNSAVSGIEGAPEGYQIVLQNGETLSVDSIILATPAKAAAPLLRNFAPDAAEALATIRATSIGTITLAFRRDEIPHALDGHGIVIPPSEGRRIDGITWTTAKWNNRAPAEIALLRVFFGGPHTRDMMTLDDDGLTDAVRGELEAILGINDQPLFNHVHRWADGYPHYDVGHLERIELIEAVLPAGIVVCGSSYRGIGVPDCIMQGKAAAEKIFIEPPKRQERQEERIHS